MRYSKTESTFILGNFNIGDSVTITVTRLSDDTEVVTDAACTEIGSTGVFKYQFSQTITSKEEYLWVMSNGSQDQRGKLVLGGFMDDLAVESTAQSIKAKTDNLPTDPASQSDVETKIDAAEAAIRGADNDDLKTVSDQLDVVQTDLDNPDQYKADVSALALDATAQSIKAKTDNLPTDPASQSDVETKIDAAEANIRGADNDDIKTISDQLDVVQTDLDNPEQYQAPTDGLARESTLMAVKDKTDLIPPDPATISHGDANWKTATGFATQNPPSQNLDDYKADVSGLALESTAQAIKNKTDSISWADVITLVKLAGYNITRTGSILTIYEEDGSTVWRQYDISSGGRLRL